ncbi:MAG: BolA family transcriptional regulator [Deltaproteobacteria bacterium]|nr:BolA family transcriptional regulator [Deltaproteobacteria bacterium]
MVNPAEIRRRIEAELPGASVIVEDTTGGGDHFSVHVTAEQFRSLSMVQQHQRVYKSLSDLMAGPGAPLHALALKTQAPA